MYVDIDIWYKERVAHRRRKGRQGRNRAPAIKLLVIYRYVWIDRHIYIYRVGDILGLTLVVYRLV